MMNSDHKNSEELEMPKRFLDTMIFDEDWFVGLSGPYQLFTLFNFSKCDHAGILKSNKMLFQKLSGFDIDLNDYFKKVNIDQQRIIVLENGRWFITGFIQFQYFDKVKDFNLNSNNPLHRSIINILRENNVPEGAPRGLRGVSTDTKDKDKVKDKDKDKNKDNRKDAVTPETLFEYYNETLKICKGFPIADKLTEDRKAKCRTRLREDNYFEAFKKAIERAKMTPFLQGQNDRKWKMSFDFLIKNGSNVYKIIEGNYDGPGKKNYKGKW
jgi:hypothetical protein